MDDLELVREYATNASEEAFRTLLERHVALVHGVALRVTGDAGLAEEVTQSVFTILARKARRLRSGTVLCGWLYRCARLVALEALRTERRRQQRERSLMEIHDSSETNSIWNQIAPLLDEAMSRLADRDRDALVLRFFEERSFAEVARTLGTTEAAAKMRVGRSLERLRALLGRRGVVIPAAALVATLSANASVAAPAGLCACVLSAASAASTGLPVTLATQTITFMSWSKVKTVAIAAVVTLFAIGGTLTLGWWRWHPHKVTTFAPMAGEWEGTFDMQAAGAKSPGSQNAYLHVRTADEGRSCQIEMQLLDAAREPSVIYRFKHSLNAAGDKIFTVNDPQLGRPNVEGDVIESRHNERTTEWRAAVRAALPENSGKMECRWERRGDELHITRLDETSGANGPPRLFSELKLRRQVSVSQVP